MLKNTITLENWYSLYESHICLECALRTQILMSDEIVRANQHWYIIVRTSSLAICSSQKWKRKEPLSTKHQASSFHAPDTYFAYINSLYIYPPNPEPLLIQINYISVSKIQSLNHPSHLFHSIQLYTNLNTTNTTNTTHTLHKAKKPNYPTTQQTTQTTPHTKEQK